MSFSVAVYSTSKNWKNESEKHEKDLKDSKTEAGRLKDRLEKLEKSIVDQLKAKDDENMALYAQIDIFQAEAKKSGETLNQLQTAINTATQTIKTTHTSLNTAQAQQDDLRKVFRQTQQDWNVLLSNFVEKTDLAHTLSMKLNNLESVSQELVKQYNDAKLVLGQFGLKPVPELYKGVPPFQVTGRITDIRPATSMVQVTIGEDSGLMKGHQLDIYRKSEDGRDIYLGVVEVVLTTPNRAACKVLPEYRKGTVQVDDIVTSEFSQERQKYQIKRDAHVATAIN
jgi:hypothetical protein